MIPMKPAKPTLIQPSVDLDIISGNNGVVHVSIVATASMVDKAFGIKARHIANTPTTNAIE